MMFTSRPRKYALPKPLAITIAALGMLVAVASCVSAQSANYYWKYFATNGTSISPFYNNDNNWGYHNGSGSGFMEMVKGEEFGYYSSTHNLPKQIYQLTPCPVSFSSTFAVNSGGRIDECMDCFVQNTFPPNTNIQGYEIMVWSYYQGTQPIASGYNAQGQAVPNYTGVSLDGKTYNVYNTSTSSAYGTTTFIQQNQSTSYSLNFQDYVNWCCNNVKAYNFNAYLDSIGCGWEWANGWATCTSLSINDGGSGGGAIANGNYFIQNRTSGLYLDTLGSTTNGASVGQYSYGGNNNQNWSVQTSGGTSTLGSLNGYMFLDSLGRNTNGSNVGLWTGSGSSNQQWTIASVGGNYYRLTNRANGLCLDSLGQTANGSYMAFWANSVNYNQQWQFHQQTNF